jgi:phosphoglycolate phosphatase-like HAD superfamily hydrolase
VTSFGLCFCGQVKVIQSVVEIVLAGAARGLPMAVASGGTRKHVMEGLTESGLLKYFGAIVTGEVRRGLCVAALPGPAHMPCRIAGLQPAVARLACTASRRARAEAPALSEGRRR